MSTRSRDAGRLAQLLTEHVGVDVRVTYHGNAKDRHGGWHVEWTDGPTENTMRELVIHLGWDGIRAYDRGHTDRAEACALLTWLSEHPDTAQRLPCDSLVAHEAHNRAEHPEVADDDTQRRARTLLQLGAGRVNGDVIQNLRQRAVGGGWTGVLDWLDAISSSPAAGVVSLEAARRRRE